mmetsp:Transcript_8555/g.24547  ORF Transcript_8555/g.24547 Transcript_8555/m.24547 type:complete len:356 (+) Transcript_8555:550-1617(+)
MTVQAADRRVPSCSSPPSCRKRSRWFSMPHCKSSSLCSSLPVAMLDTAHIASFSSRGGRGLLGSSFSVRRASTSCAPPAAAMTMSISAAFLCRRLRSMLSASMATSTSGSSTSSLMVGQPSDSITAAFRLRSDWYIRFFKALTACLRRPLCMLLERWTSCWAPPFFSTCSLMGEKSSTMLHRVALAMSCTSVQGSCSRRSSGAATSASTSALRCCFTVRLRLRMHRQAASRTPDCSCSRALATGARTLASISCLRLSSLSMHKVPRACRVPSSRCPLQLSSLRKAASLLMASASAAIFCNSSRPSTRRLSTRGTCSRTSGSPSSFISTGRTAMRTLESGLAEDEEGAEEEAAHEV